VALAAAGAMAYAQGDTAVAERYWTDGHTVARRTGRLTVAAQCLAGIGVVKLAAADLSAAECALIGTLTLTNEAGPDSDWVESLTEIWLGTVRLLSGDHVAAEERMHRGLAAARRRGDRLTTYIGLYNLSQAAMAANDFDTVRHHLREGIELSRQTRDAANLAYFCQALAVVDGKSGRPQRAATLLGAAEAMRRLAGAEVYSYYRPDSAVLARLGSDTRATLGAEAFDAAFGVGQEFTVPDVVHYAFPDD
jgi:hypothetical protein